MSEGSNQNVLRSTERRQKNPKERKKRTVRAIGGDRVIRDGGARDPSAPRNEMLERGEKSSTFGLAEEIESTLRFPEA